ncbi:hypothetical protein GCM10009785_34860 [Brooklawnia cerclae]|uniref:HK97 family phage major capsid protein n=1 Tax=Brooklawnia cerclae TaxID=349934 RepID=A0ABX0SJ90_9ACTN|nr:phage major capsid protein [Brooklawnia cerclae]NIH58475.1 HK97 family phage major capsid protein [Brooklawnia cerclae]
MATLTTTTLVGGTGGTNLLPRRVSDEIWKKATAASIVPRLAQSSPVILGDNIFPTLTARPAATIVGEGGNKTDSQLELGAKVIRPIKAQVGLEFTIESIEQNPSGVLGLLQTELSEALARQIDLAVFHKLVAASGTAIEQGDVALDTAPSYELVDINNIDAEIEAGYGVVTDAGYDFTGFAMDPKFVARLRQAVNQKNGQRYYPELGFSNQIDSFNGLTTAVSKTVSGQVDAVADTKVRAIAGDFSALKYGYALNIPVKKIEYGDPFGNGDLQRRNSVAYLAEVIFGWAILDVNAFVVFKDADGAARTWDLVVSGGASGDTFTLTVGAATTAAIAYNASAEAIETALNALSGVTASVTGTVTKTITLSAPAVVSATGTFAGAGSVSVTAL